MLMSISNKIDSRIDNLNETDEFKALMRNILNVEDEGVYRFKEKYETYVNEYINASLQEDQKND